VRIQTAATYFITSRAWRVHQAVTRQQRAYHHNRAAQACSFFGKLGSAQQLGIHLPCAKRVNADTLLNNLYAQVGQQLNELVYI